MKINHYDFTRIWEGKKDFLVLGPSDLEEEVIVREYNFQEERLTGRFLKLRLLDLKHISSLSTRFEFEVLEKCVSTPARSLSLGSSSSSPTAPSPST